MTSNAITEAIGNLVVINGKFVVIDHTFKEEDEKGIATVVRVFSSDNDARAEEMRAVNFCSGSGGCFNAGNTTFNLTHIWRSSFGNDHLLKEHQPTKMVVVKNETTEEFFLLMDENETFPTARKFLWDVSQEKSPLLDIGSRPGNYKSLRLPHETMLGALGVTGDPKFEVVMHSGIITIKLQLY